MAYVLTLLSGRAREWGVAVWNSRAPCCAAFEDFRLSQRKSSVTEYAIQFQTLAAACGWNEGALRARFLEGLDHAIADELAALDLPRE
ncbi:MAG: hypothetical protein ACRC4P_05355, partial [Aeromonas sp.]